jgi:hypothetical protein
MATQLRRYELVPGTLEDFVAWFPRVVEARQRHGFEVVFAAADHDAQEFVWAVRHPGDFAQAEAEYNASPERAAAFLGQPRRVSIFHVAMVELCWPISEESHSAGD